MPGTVVSPDFLNFQEVVKPSVLIRFRNDLIDILLFQSVFRSLGVAFSRGEYGVIIFRLIDGILDWFSYFYQVLFPFILLFFFCLVVECY